MEPGYLCKVCSSAVGLEDSRLVKDSCTCCRVCTSCKWQITPKCAVKGCKTPKRKQILKSLPARVQELAPAAWISLSLEFGISKDTLNCCSSCFLKLHRAAASYQNFNRTNETTSAGSPQSLDSCFSRSGRPPTSYEAASTRTKQAIEKKAKELLRNNVEELKTKLNDISQGSGELLHKCLLEKQIPSSYNKVRISLDHQNWQICK